MSLSSLPFKQTINSNTTTALTAALSHPDPLGNQPAASGNLGKHVVGRAPTTENRAARRRAKKLQTKRMLQVRAAPVPKDKRGKVVRRKLEKQGAPLPKQTQPDPIDKSATSQGRQRQPAGFVDVWSNWFYEKGAEFGVIEPAEVPTAETGKPAEPEHKQEPAKTVAPATSRSGDYRSMDFFLKRIEGKFTCQRFGEPCTAHPKETLKGKVVLIGVRHTEISEEWSEELIRRFKRPGDKVVVEFTPTFLEHDGNRKVVCLGVSRQDCLAGEVEQIKDPVDAAAVKSINLRFQLLASLDPDAANAIIANYNNENANSFWLSLNEQYDKSYPLRWPSLTAEQRETTVRLFDEYEAAVRDYHALAAQAQQARDQNYVRLLESEMANRETTIYVPIGEAHVPTIIESFRDNDRVVALYPTRRGEPRRNPRIYG